MPLYEFHCEQCGQESEVLVRSRDGSDAKCPHCGSAKLEKKFSTFASKSEGSGSAPSSPGGGCGGGCGCHAGPHRH